MKRIIALLIILAVIFAVGTLSIAQDKKAPKEASKSIQEDDTTMVWQKTADIKANLKYQLEQMEAQPTIQQYKALTIQYNIIDQIQNDSLKFKKQNSR